MTLTGSPCRFGKSQRLPDALEYVLPGNPACIAFIDGSLQRGKLLFEPFLPSGLTVVLELRVQRLLHGNDSTEGTIPCRGPSACRFAAHRRMTNRGVGRAHS